VFVQLTPVAPLQEQDLLTVTVTFCADCPKEFCAKVSNA